ncbi:MAG TPA: tetratricopeptide repeat protein [Terriglobales bacterium]|nr:tetratricopeptide repeat protein [Terriglobales bacterium]
MERYQRADVLRILRITARQLGSWEKAGLVAVGESYSFFDLLQIKKLRDLSAKRVRPAVIRESLRAMQRQVAGMENPLLEAGTFSTDGRRIVFRHRGRSVEPIAGQFLLDFGTVENVVPAKVKYMRPAETAEEYFARGVALEEDPGMQNQAIEAYEQAIELDPRHAAAHINLGTLHYNRRDYVQAEKHYRAAIASDPRYALAYFDLGNVLDETGRLPEAVETYKRAIQLAANYADAHYNLALAYEKLGQPRKALPHWRTYLRMDSSGPWAVHARAQIHKILENEGLQVVGGKK